MALWETNGQTNVLMENLPILQDTAAQRACLKPVSAPKLAHMEIAIKSELKCIEIYFSNLDIKLLNRAFWAVELWYHMGGDISLHFSIPAPLLDLPHPLAVLSGPQTGLPDLWLASQTLWPTS